MLVLAVTELHQALPVQANPRYAALFCRTYQRCGTRAKCTTLRIANESVPLFAEFPIVAGCIVWFHFCRQEAVDQRQRQLACFATNCVVVVLEDHVVVAGFSIDRTRPAEGHGVTSNILQFDRDVFHDMPEPCAIVFFQPADEPAGLVVGAAVFLQSR